MRKRSVLHCQLQRFKGFDANKLPGHSKVKVPHAFFLLDILEIVEGQQITSASFRNGQSKQQAGILWEQLMVAIKEREKKNLTLLYA